MRNLSEDEMKWVVGGFLASQRQDESPGRGAQGHPIWDDPNTQQFMRDYPDHPLNDPAYRASVERLQQSNASMINSIYQTAYDQANLASSAPGLGKNWMWVFGNALYGAAAGVVKEMLDGPVDQRP